MRTATYTYVEYVDGDRELYDLRHDPYELTNVYDRATHATKIALSRRARRDRRHCRGRQCRAGDARPRGGAALPAHGGAVAQAVRRAAPGTSRAA